MNEKPTINVERVDGVVMQVLPDGSKRPLPDETDWARLAAMTEEEIEAAARADEENLPLSEAELKRFKPIPNLREIRQRLQMTQEQFAIRFHLPLGTLRDWEQGARTPDTAAQSYLRVIAKNPEAVLQALEG